MTYLVPYAGTPGLTWPEIDVLRQLDGSPSGAGVPAPGRTREAFRRLEGLGLVAEKAPGSLSWCLTDLGRRAAR